MADTPESEKRDDGPGDSHESAPHHRSKHKAVSQGTPGHPAHPHRRTIKNRLLEKFLIDTAAHAVVLGVLAVASVIWVYFTKNPSVPRWGFILLVILLIFTGYLVLISVQYFFRGNFVVAHRWDLHVVLLAIVVMVASIPLAMMQSYTNSRTSELLAQKQTLEEEAKGKEQALQEVVNRVQKDREVADINREKLYHHVTASLSHILQKSGNPHEDLRNLMQYCIEAISINNPKAKESDLRSTVVFLHKEGNLLLVPPQGYFGTNLHQEIAHLYFDVSPRRPEEKDTEKYLRRLGVAGWCYVNNTSILENDVLMPTKDYRYKYFEPDSDHAMICVLIPNLNATSEGRYLGVLSISSLSAGVFTEADKALAQFFATLLAHFSFMTPREVPQFVVEDQRNNGTQ